MWVGLLVLDREFPQRHAEMGNPRCGSGNGTGLSRLKNNQTRVLVTVETGGDSGGASNKAPQGPTNRVLQAQDEQA